MLREKLIFFILIIPKSIWQKIFTTELAPTLKDVGKITGASKTILSFGITGLLLVIVLLKVSTICMYKLIVLLE